MHGGFGARARCVLVRISMYVKCPFDAEGWDRNRHLGRASRKYPIFFVSCSVSKRCVVTDEVHVVWGLAERGGVV